MSDEHTNDELHARQCRSERRERILLGCVRLAIGLVLTTSKSKFAGSWLDNGAGLLGIELKSYPTLGELLAIVEEKVSLGWDAMPELEKQGRELKVQEPIPPQESPQIPAQ